MTLPFQVLINPHSFPKFILTFIFIVPFVLTSKYRTERCASRRAREHAKISQKGGLSQFDQSALEEQAEKMTYVTARPYLLELNVARNTSVVAPKRRKSLPAKITQEPPLDTPQVDEPLEHLPKTPKNGEAPISQHQKSLHSTAYENHQQLETKTARTKPTYNTRSSAVSQIISATLI